MTKQDKIIEVWGVLYEKYKERISLDDGYLHIKSNKALKEVKSIFNEIQFTVGGGISIFRPRELQGIENNNGWTKIESEVDLPKSKGVYKICFDGVPQLGEIEYPAFIHYLYSDKDERNLTHFKSLQNEKPPIY